MLLGVHAGARRLRPRSRPHTAAATSASAAAAAVADSFSDEDSDGSSDSDDDDDGNHGVELAHADSGSAVPVGSSTAFTGNIGSDSHGVERSHANSGSGVPVSHGAAAAVTRRSTRSKAPLPVLAEFDFDAVGSDDDVAASTTRAMRRPRPLTVSGDVFTGAQAGAAASGVRGVESSAAVRSADESPVSRWKPPSTFIAEVQKAQGSAPAAEQLRWANAPGYSRLVVDGTSMWFHEARAVIPKGAILLQERLMRVAHDQMRHSSAANTLRALRRIPFTWEGMTRSVVHWCKSCYACATRKARDTTARHGLMQRSVGTYAGQRWGMDFLGPLTKSDSGLQYILVLTDSFSGFTILAAVPAQTGAAVVEVLKQLVSLFCAPMFLNHDSGKPLDCELVDAFCKAHGIQRHRTTAYHHQSMGQVERVNADVMLGLRLKALTDSRWDEHVGHVQMMLNCGYCESIGMSPFRAMFGRDPRTAVEQLTGVQPDAAGTPEEVALMEEAVHDAVLIRRDAAFLVRKTRHDALFKPVEFAVGSLVMVGYPRQGKLGLSRKGPREVLRKHDDLSYWLRNRLTDAEERIHVSRLTAFDGSRLRPNEELQALLKEGNYMVERISEHAYGAGGVLYLKVHWMGAVPRPFTWELWTNMERTVAAQAYRTARKLKVRQPGARKHTDAEEQEHADAE